MAPWRQTIDELRILLEHQGAFRDVRFWGAGNRLQKIAYLFMQKLILVSDRREIQKNWLIRPVGV